MDFHAGNQAAAPIALEKVPYEAAARARVRHRRVYLGGNELRPLAVARAHRARGWQNAYPATPAAPSLTKVPRLIS